MTGVLIGLGLGLMVGGVIVSAKLPTENYPINVAVLGLGLVVIGYFSQAIELLEKLVG
jgi:hypothetical protein